MGKKSSGGQQTVIREVPAPASTPADYSNTQQRQAAVAQSTNSQTSSMGSTFGADLGSSTAGA